MGRGKIEIKKIENPTSRQVTFSKRRGGLIKKASELAVLCDAEIAVIIFSSTGKLFEFSSNGGMKQILERYSKNADGVQTGRISDNSDYMSREVMKLRQQLEHSQHSQRQMLGEDLAVLNVHDLLQLEQQLDVGVNRVRQRRSQLLMEEIEELRRKVFERELHEENEDLRRKLVDAKGIADAAARGVPGLNSNLQSPNARSEPAATQPVPQVYPLQPNLRDPQPTSQPSLQLGLFAPSRSRGPAHQNSGAETEAGSRHGEWMSQ